MKTFQFILKPALAFFIIMIYAGNAQAQKDKEAAVKNMIAAQNYIFRAQSVMPMRGRTRQLTSEYEVRITKDSIVSFLPYFGRAYTAPMNMTGGGIQFNSKDFDYSATPAKKGGWDILIKPKDVNDVQQLSLSVTSSGYALLQVISNSRQPISFNGYIMENKQKNK